MENEHRLDKLLAKELYLHQVLDCLQGQRISWAKMGWALQKYLWVYYPFTSRRQEDHDYHLGIIMKYLVRRESVLVEMDIKRLLEDVVEPELRAVRQTLQSRANLPVSSESCEQSYQPLHPPVK